MKLHVEHVRINRQGYTRQGRYFGVGQKLYLVYSDRGEIHEYVRAPDARAARAAVTAKHRIARDGARSNRWGGVRMCPCAGETRLPPMATYDPEAHRDASRRRRRRSSRRRRRHS